MHLEEAVEAAVDMDVVCVSNKRTIMEALTRAESNIISFVGSSFLLDFVFGFFLRAL